MGGQATTGTQLHTTGRVSVWARALARLDGLGENEFYKRWHVFFGRAPEKGNVSGGPLVRAVCRVFQG